MSPRRLSREDPRRRARPHGQEIRQNARGGDPAEPEVESGSKSTPDEHPLQ